MASKELALVIGVDGQDGSYLAEHLNSAGVEIVGLGRRESARVGTELPNFRYITADAADAAELKDILETVRPTRIYHLAATHGASGFFYEDVWQGALAVNLASVHICLEYIRCEQREVRLLYASSLKAFGSSPPSVVSEASPRISECLYSITKNASADLIEYYRRTHSVRATTLYLFNHESPRRPENFFLPRVVNALAAAMLQQKDDTTLASLDFACDWGSAKEFMSLGWQVLESPENQDYVIATGKTWTGLEFVEALFLKAGLDWQDHLTVAKTPGSELIVPYRADISRLKNVIGHSPVVDALGVAGWILNERHQLKI